MGFFDSFKNAEQKRSEEIENSRRSSYQTVKQRESEYKRMSDGELLQAYKDFFTSDDDKKIIKEELTKNRGYEENNGRWNKK